jgi:hypothetical protein
LRLPVEYLLSVQQLLRPLPRPPLRLQSVLPLPPRKLVHAPKQSALLPQQQWPQQRLRSDGNCRLASKRSGLVHVSRQSVTLLPLLLRLQPARRAPQRQTKLGVSGWKQEGGREAGTVLSHPVPTLFLIPVGGTLVTKSARPLLLLRPPLSDAVAA